MKLAVAPAAYHREDQARMRGALERADDQNLKRGVAAAELLLSAPNGQVWRVTVSNSGALSATAL
jgi:hypothetical protein